MIKNCHFKSKFNANLKVIYFLTLQKSNFAEVDIVTKRKNVQISTKVIYYLLTDVYIRYSMCPLLSYVNNNMV